MNDLDQRPIEMATLLNPAFCSILLNDFISAFEKETGKGVQYAILFLVLPIILHESTRKMLPTKTSSKMHAWVQNNPEVHINFPERAQVLVPYTKEALIFGLQSGIIGINEEGHFTKKGKLKKPSWHEDSEPSMCRKKAKFLGKWFAQSGTLSTIFIIWGIRL